MQFVMRTAEFSRRQVLQGVAAMTCLGVAGPTGFASGHEIPRGPAQPFRPDHVERLARELATRPFKRHRYVTSEWMELHYEQYQQIHFRKEAGLWHGSRLPFEAQLLLPGMLYRNPVDIYLVEGAEARQLLFSLHLFRSDYPMPPLDPAGANGYSGVRLLSAPQREDGIGEFAVFQGGSYFRAISRDQAYGLSARGLALKTADPDGEEFPVFGTFWLETPGEYSDGVRLHALMDSESVAGAYTFDVRPGSTTVIDVEAVLFPRVILHLVGVAPISSMFKFNQTNRWNFDDFRSGVHDSNGLLMANGAGEWLWRPLANPADLQVASFLDENPRGFGLMQRERDFNRFGDLVAHYHQRPSLWVEPKADWGRGAVFLVEIPTDTEVNDNIVAFWRPEEPWPAGSEQRLTYRLSWGWNVPKKPGLARVLDTRLGRDQFGASIAAIDFGPHPGFAETSEIQPDVVVEGGQLHGTWFQPNEHTGGLRLSFSFGPDTADALELRAQLLRNGTPLTEVWLYRWSKAASARTAL